MTMFQPIPKPDIADIPIIGIPDPNAPKNSWWLLPWAPPEPLEKGNAHIRRAPAGGLSGFAGGQFLPNDLWYAERHQAALALPTLLDHFGERLQLLRAFYEQNAALAAEGLTKIKLVPLTTVEAQMKTAVREAYEQAFLLGKRASGNLTSITAREKEAVKGLRLDEFRYLRAFLQDMREGSGAMDYTQRADYYRAAARELYWLGWVLGNQASGRKVVWKNGQTEHCKDCLRFAQHGPYSIQEFTKDVLGAGYLPQSGRLECIGYHCKCWLEEA